MAGWAVHNTAAAVLLIASVVFAVLTTVTSLTGDRFRIVPLPPSEAAFLTIQLVERHRSDLAGLASLFGLTPTVTTDEMTAQPYTEPPWQNYALPVLVGVGVLPNRRLAILRLASGQTRVFTEGEQWEEFTVTKVLAGSVLLERSDSTRIVSLLRNQ